MDYRGKAGIQDVSSHSSRVEPRLGNMTEQQPYSVQKKYEGFELRNYPRHVLVQVTVRGSFISAGSIGFGPLIRYISGGNQTGQKIPMTAPVVQSSHDPETHVVSFVLPAGMQLSDVPIPADARVSVAEQPEQLVAAKRFSGGWNQDRFTGESEELLAAVTKAGLATLGNVYFARYDPPWKPGFLKRNEALIQISAATK